MSPVIQADAPFRKMRLVWTVEGPGSCEIDLREDQDLADWTPPHRIHVQGPRDWGGEITRLSRSGGPNDIGVGDRRVGYKASGLGHEHRLDYRIVRHDLAVNDEVAVIVEALLSEAQDNQYNGDMGFTMGSVVGTTVSRERGYCVGVNIGDAIRELSSIGRGFDWEIDADGRLNIWNRTRGIDTGLTLAETDVSDWDIELDTSEMLTNVTSIADPSQVYGPAFRMSHFRTDTGPFFANPYGRRETAIDTDIIALDEKNPQWEQELYDAGDALLEIQGGGRLMLRAMWLSHQAPWNFGDVWLQDRVTVDLPDYFGGPQSMRCTDITMTIEPMPPHAGGAPIYFVEQGFDALVEDLYVLNSDPDQETS